MKTFTSTYNNKENGIVFDPDTSMVIMDNSENFHSFNVSTFLIAEIQQCKKNESGGTIGRRSLLDGIGTVEYYI